MGEIKDTSWRSAGHYRRWGVLAVASALIFVVYVMQYQVAALSFDLVPRFGLDAVALSNLMFAPMLLAAFAGIPLGALADRFGVRRVVGTCVVVSLVGAVVRVFASSYSALVVASAVVGLAPAAMNANLMRLMGAWFGERSGFAIGVYYACSGFGASAAMLTSAYFTYAQCAFAVSSLLLAAVGVLWWLVVADAPRGTLSCAASSEGARKTAGGLEAFIGGQPSAQAGAPSGIVGCLQMAARNPVVWAIALITGFGLAAKTAYLSFLPQALTTTSLSAADANFLAAFVTYGGIAGCVLGPLVCARRRRPRAFVIGCAFASAALVVASVVLLDRPHAALFFAVGFVSSMTAPIVEAIPCVMPQLCACAGSAGGIIGSVSLAATYFIPLVISAVSGGSYAVIVGLMGACFVLMAPLVMTLPGIVADDFREEGRVE